MDFEEHDQRPGAESKKARPLVNVFAIVAGFACDFVGTYAFNFVVAIIMVLFMKSRGIEGEALESGLNQFMSGNAYCMFSILIGFSFTMLGGYIAGRVAKHGELFHAGAVGVINVLFSLYFMEVYPAWYWLVVFMVIPVAIFGGYNAKKYNTAGRKRIL